MNIGKTIKRIRQQRGMSQIELAEKSGLAQNVISRIERDKHKPTETTVKILAEALDVQKDVFYYLSILDLAQQSNKNGLKAKLAPVFKEEIGELFGLD